MKTLQSETEQSSQELTGSSLFQQQFHQWHEKHDEANDDKASDF